MSKPSATFYGLNFAPKTIQNKISEGTNLKTQNHAYHCHNFIVFKNRTKSPINHSGDNKNTISNESTKELVIVQSNPIETTFREPLKQCDVKQV